MTEDEAKTKWCPFARNAEVSEYGSQNRTTDGELDKACLCIGSQCIAWKYVSPASMTKNMKTGEVITEGIKLEGNSYVREGYCGMVGNQC